MIVPVPDHIAPAEELGRVHFVGIGGAALSAIARLMHERGVGVSGCDAADSPMLDSLRALGIPCVVGHDATHVDGVDTVVVSTAVHDGLAEVEEARTRGLRLWPRAAAVQSLMLGQRAIVVTGTHGKTTTTSMLVTALQACGADPSYAIGSTLLTTGRNAAVGTDPMFVAEGDESDAAILAYTPYAAVVTNVDVDHLDFFGSAEAYAAVFDRFLDRVERDGFVVCGVDDLGGRRLALRAIAAGLSTVTVGAKDPSADVRAVDVRADGGGSTCEVVAFGRSLGTMRLGVPGPGYLVDALAALATGLRLEFPAADLLRGLAGFRGTGRRMEPKGSIGGVAVYDSYAHHPVEIEADLSAARQVAGDGRLVVVFQPHLYSRTREFGSRMGLALGAADDVVVLDVYPAREDPIEGVTGALVADAVPLSPDSVVYEPEPEQVLETLARRLRPGDLVLTLGAGDVTALGPRLLAWLADAEETPDGDVADDTEANWRGALRSETTNGDQENQ